MEGGGQSFRQEDPTFQKISENYQIGAMTDLEFSQFVKNLTDKQGPVSKGINVATDGDTNYADLIVSGDKQYETRDTDSLRPYVGKKVGIVETKKGEKAKLVGYATVGEPQVVDQTQFDAMRDLHLVPKGSKFDIKQGENKHLYQMINPERLAEPIDVSGSKGIVARDISRGVSSKDKFSRRKDDIEDQRINYLTQRLAYVRGSLDQDTDMFPATRRKLEREERQLSGELRGATRKDKYSIRAFHGSPHDFDRFSSEAIGTGEGAAN
jgi:hypothetical protein